MTPGWDTDLDPYRAELGGIYGCIKMVNLLAKHYHVTTGSITLACDCSSALSRLTQPTPPRPHVPHYDLITACRYALQQSPVRWHVKHVRGHQDVHQPYHSLDFISQLNVDMDQLAKSYWSILNSNRPAPFSLPSPDQWGIYSGPRRLVSWNRRTAQQLFFNRTRTDYWQTRVPNAFPFVDWDACGAALRGLKHSLRLWVPRWLTSFLPTGNRVAYIPTTPISVLCPRCLEPELHRYHVIRCSHPGARLLWQQNLTRLDSWLVLQHTKPTLRHGIIQLLEAWYSDTPWAPQIPFSAPEDQFVFNAQQQAGTDRALDGFLVTHWASAQHQYYLWLQRRTTGRRWLARLIQKIWEIAWDLWRHRHKVMTEANSLATSRLHVALDTDILQAYERYTPNPPPRLARWFSRPFPALQSESLDFKRQWLEMIRAFSPTPPSP